MFLALTLLPFGIWTAVLLAPYCGDYYRTSSWMHWFSHWQYYDCFWICFFSILCIALYCRRTNKFEKRPTRFFIILIYSVGFCFVVFGLFNAESSDTFGYPWLLAEIGSDEAQIKMASQIGFWGGKDVERQYEDKKYWLQKAAESGSLEGKVALYRFLLGDLFDGYNSYTHSSEAIRWLKSAAEERDPLAENDLSCLYRRQLEKPTNYLTADELLHRSSRDQDTTPLKIDSRYVRLCNQN